MKTIILNNICLKSFFSFNGGWTNDITFCGIIEVSSSPYQSFFFEYHLDENRVVYFDRKNRNENKLPLGELQVILKNEEDNLDELVVAFAKLCSLDYVEIKDIYINNFNITANFLDILEIAEEYAKEKLKEYFFQEIISSFGTEELIQLTKEIEL